MASSVWESKNCRPAVLTANLTCSRPRPAGIIQSSANLTKASGWALMAVAALVVHLFVGSASHATGGKELPMGPPILHA